LDITLINAVAFNYFSYNIPSDSISRLMWPINGKMVMKKNRTTLERQDGIQLSFDIANDKSIMSFIMFPEPYPYETTFY